ncbi:hypothetical protein [Gracilimonas sp.]|uniref:hypothetical protein n=1 Tax=Gracilimonas sp. TaxID=1974203 RepID=UPI002870B6FB|nr:hypothetical protein [Gracilimonas sp.]
MKLLKLFVTTILITSFAFLTGCDITTSNNDGDKSKSVAVNMQVKTNTAAKSKAVSLDSLTEIKLLVEELELESVNDDSSDFEVENFIINIPVTGDSVQLTTSEIPVGIYDEFSIEIEYDDDNNSISNPDFTDGDTNYSFVVKGVYNGEEFMFRSAEDFEIELDLNPVLEISETTSSAAITVSLDTSGWFVDENGNPLDPNESSNREQIEQNIENSFEAEGEEEDDDDD